jgi:hypothetical protein
MEQEIFAPVHRYGRVPVIDGGTVREIFASISVLLEGLPCRLKLNALAGSNDQYGRHADSPCRHSEHGAGLGQLPKFAATEYANC